MGKFDADNYVDVHARIQEFYAKYPDGRLVTERWEVVEVNGRWFVVTESLAYRTVDDPLPAKGLAWEPVPGGTPFTRDSELMNSETSSWGRAIVALGGFDTKIASADEVRNRQYDERPSGPPMPQVPPFDTPTFQQFVKEHGITKEQIAYVLNVPPSKLQKGIDVRTAAQGWALANNVTTDVEMALIDAIRKGTGQDAA
mgnify:FL=1